MAQFRTLLTALVDEDTRASAALDLASMQLSKDQAAALRLTPGGVRCLLTLFEPQAQGAAAALARSFIHKLEEAARAKDAAGAHMDAQPAASAPVAVAAAAAVGGGACTPQLAALRVALSAATLDVQFKLALVAESVVRKVWSARLLDQPSSEATLLAVRLLHQCINNGDMRREPAVQEMFRLGCIGHIARFLDDPVSPELCEAAGNVVWEVTDLPAYRERIRDLGVVPSLLRLASKNPQVSGYMGTINNLSRSDGLHITLDESGLLPAMTGMLRESLQEVNRVEALITVAHVYGGQDRNEAAQELLSMYDVSSSIVAMMDSALHGDAMFGGAWWALEEVVHGVASLCRSPGIAQKLDSLGMVGMLVEALQKHSSDEEAVLRCCQALLNMSLCQELQSALIKDGVVEAIKVHQESEDGRIADAAKGCLLQLGLLDNRAAMEANSKLEGDDVLGETYDVFLSHKRSDAKDFARALYNLLVVRGISTFLDFEYREELELENGLARIVANCRNVVFIMTDNIFESPWCIKELEAALERKCNIILVVKEGSRWRDESGNKASPFPTPVILQTLRPDVQKVFTRKAIMHSDEYYQTFVDMLLKKIVISPRAAPLDTGLNPTSVFAAAPDHMQQGPTGSFPAAARSVPSSFSTPAPTASSSIYPGLRGGSVVGAVPPLGGLSSTNSPAGSFVNAGMPPAMYGLAGSNVSYGPSSMEMSMLRMELLTTMHDLRSSVTMQLQEVRSELSRGLGQLQRDVTGSLQQVQMNKDANWSQVQIELASVSQALAGMRGMLDGMKQDVADAAVSARVTQQYAASSQQYAASSLGQQQPYQSQPYQQPPSQSQPYQSPAYSVPAWRPPQQAAVSTVGGLPSGSNGLGGTSSGVTAEPAGTLAQSRGPAGGGSVGDMPAADGSLPPLVRGQSTQSSQGSQISQGSNSRHTSSSSQLQPTLVPVAQPMQNRAPPSRARGY